ncbi:hypothetical protein [Kallotenue papyrolyticum]|uniref:hypothetical protein n=1 Tax=Kallotenue papyrolyticum TaxID=1325125 RepID=UPI000492478E|nr:hypothetical protein [Kallotenue papyrolyticum]
MSPRHTAQQALKRAARQIRRTLISRPVQPNWTQLLSRDQAAWQRYREVARNGPKVLIATSTGGHRAVTPLESLLAVALTLRGANVHVLLCDKVLPACLQATSIEFWRQSTFVKHGPKALCDDCFDPGYSVFSALDLPLHRYGNLISAAEHQNALELAQTLPIEAIPGYRLEGLAVGEHALAGALRYFAKGRLQDERYGEAVLRRYLHASLLTVYAMQRLLDQHGFEAACFHHGIYVPQGLVGEVCRRRGVRVVNWNPAYRKQCFIFSHDDTYHHTLMTEPTSVWERIDWHTGLEQKMMDYLKSRWQGTNDWIWFHDRPNENVQAITAELGIDLSKPCIGLLTNVVWDAQLHYPANAFPSMIDWVIETIRYFERRPDLQLIIRAHPAEIRGWLPSRQPIVDEIRKVFPRLPTNVTVIPPESDISTYAIMSCCDSVLIYGTKTGVELTSMGIPVIVAGEAWIRNKGITMDARTAEEYFELLERLPLGHRLDQMTIQRARQYAYHFFFRRMIPVKAMQPTPGWPPYQVQINGLADLLPGHDPGLDIICEGILNGTDFIYKDEEIGNIEIFAAKA